jgi:hypothetical protein
VRVRVPRKLRRRQGEQVEVWACDRCGGQESVARISGGRVQLKLCRGCAEWLAVMLIHGLEQSEEWHEAEQGLIS